MTMEPTTDMTLVAYLALRRITPASIEVSALGTASWMFAPSPELNVEAAAFRAGKARVEPKAFHGMLNRVRREMMAVLDDSRAQLEGAGDA